MIVVRRSLYGWAARAFGLTVGLAVIGCSEAAPTNEGVADASVEASTRPAPPPSDALDPSYTGPPRPPAGSAPPVVVDGPELNPCSSATGLLGAKYLDLTAPDAFRRVEWNSKSSPADEAFQLTPWRCVKVRVGQSFQWEWDGLHDLTTFHVMVGNGGTSPSFVDSIAASKKTIVATFAAAGTYGYTCDPHPVGMAGVVWVVP